jgi:hypothetical protein
VEILLDCDGVLADFVGGASEVHGKSPEIYSWDFWVQWRLEPEEFWAPLATREFWLGLRPYKWAGELLAGLRELGEVTVCTAPMHLNTEVCIGAKLDWLESYFGIRPENVMVGRKKHLMAGKHRILIDDSEGQCSQVLGSWRECDSIPSALERSGWQELSARSQQYRASIAYRDDCGGCMRLTDLAKSKVRRTGDKCWFEMLPKSQQQEILSELKRWGNG